MAGIFGNLNISDTERVFNATVGQQVIWEAVQAYLARAREELDVAMSLFVQETTEDYKRRYKLPGGGYLQERGEDGSFANVKALGSWDVAFPIKDVGAAVGGNDVDLAYMTAKELQTHIETVEIQNINTVRHEILKALFNSAQESYSDRLWGTLLVEPLANGDAVVYPPVLGASIEATDNHYLESGYASASISDSNNPYATIAAELEEHFGAPTGGSQIAAFINPAEVAKTRALAEFVPVADLGVRYGNAQDLSTAIPAELLRVGRVIGRMDTSGVWVVEWRFMTAAYIIGIHLDAPKPLIRRIDPADTQLGNGLQLVAREELRDNFPFTNSYWRHRFGLGCGNRLNGVVMELGTGGTYSVPAAYQ